MPGDVPMNKVDADALMSAKGWLSRHPEPFRAEVLRRCRLVHLEADEVVFHLGEPAGGIYGLVSGTVSVSLAPPGATPELVMLGVPGHWTGEACYLTRMPRRGELRAVVETCMLYLPLEAMDEMAQHDVEAARRFADILMMSVEFLMRVVHDLQKPQAERRIASVLQRTTWIGDTPIPLSQAQIGAMANASRKQVNAALKRFSDAGWLMNTYRAVTITDIEALRRFADGDEGLCT